ncbi:TatD family hydrolase [Treponema socranskii]|uniref:TatD family hydrolase n=1 Tax=Treponema socranskii TaxID=53419 RepID=UPI00287238B7|nr:TatD family hydrolase [Treponema socranskii]MDR9860161.1 TatD family hydrolase [Treponema socranskii]
MLAFSVLTDAHFHLACCAENSLEDSFRGLEAVLYYGVSCAHDRNEFLNQETLSAKLNENENTHVLCAFGMHPQLPLVENAGFMETLLKERRIGAIGEAGFDLFTKEFKADIVRQEEAWQISCELAALYGVPLVVHCRKALDKMFRDSKALSKIPFVVFHSFTGSVQDASSLLKRGVNAYFSFGNPLIFGDKSAIGCVQKLDVGRLLMETDAPYQTMRGETETKMSAIARVYERAFLLRYGEESLAKEKMQMFSDAIFNNFKSAYGIA